MTGRVKHPPGRAGRMWLRRRLATAELGCEQLGRKLVALLAEQERLRGQQSSCRRTWAAAVAQARSWELRAGMLGGQDAGNVRPTEHASIELTWSTTVGVYLPAEARRVGPPPDLQAPPANTAVVLAAEAFGTALAAGIELAVAEEAVRRVDLEVALTRRRVRALEKRWLPTLRQALADVEQSLERDEQEEDSRLRGALAVARPDGDDAPRSEP